MWPRGGPMANGARHYDRKIFRLIFILNRLEAERRVTSTDMAREFNVSLRTVQRDIELLNMTGFPIVNFDKGIHGFAEGFSLKKLMLSSEQASLMTFLFEISRSLGAKFEDSFRDIFSKLIAKEFEAVYYAKIPSGVKLKADDGNLARLERAVAERRRTEIVYSKPGKKAAYTLEPMKIAFFDGFWYLISIDTTAKKLIKSRIDYIKNIRLLDSCFTPRHGLKTMLDESVNIWFAEKPAKRVRLKVAAAAAPYFEAKCHFPRQKIKRRLRDGSIEIETSVSHNMEVMPTVLCWLPHIKVVQPRGLKTELTKLIRSYLK